MDSSAPVSALALDEEHPWPGLAHYSEDDYRYFFGREEQVELLARSTRRTALTILYGTSGRGKSSIIGAGLIHHLKQAGHGVTLLRRDYDTLGEEPLVARLIRRTCEDHHLGDIGLPARDCTLWQFFHDRARPWCARVDGQRAVDLPPVLIFDQFEEIFSKGEDHPANRRARASARKFLKQLASLVENRPPPSLSRRLRRSKGAEREALLDRYDFEGQPVRVVLVLRADFLARLERLRGVMPSLMQQRIELPDLSGEQALDAAFRPGALRPDQAPIISEEIAAQVVRCAANVPEDMPLKDISSVPAAILNLLCNELNEARGQHPHRQPCVTQFTSRAADGIMRTFYEKRMARHAVVRPVLEHLLAPNGSREAPLVQTVLAELAHVPGASKQILEDLPNERILVVERSGRADRIEFTHDKLAEFAKSSADSRTASERLRRRFAWAVAALVLIASVAMWTAYLQRRTALTERTLARQRRAVIEKLNAIGEGLGTAPTIDDQYGAICFILDQVRCDLGSSQGQEQELRRLEAIAKSGLGQAALYRSQNPSPAEARTHLEASAKLWDSFAKDKPDDPDPLYSLAPCRYYLGTAFDKLGDHEKAAKEFSLAAMVYQRLADLEPGGWDWRTWQTNSLREQTDQLRQAAKYDGASQVITQTEKNLREMLAALDAGQFPPEVTRTNPSSGMSWRRMLAEVGSYRGDLELVKFNAQMPKPEPNVLPDDLRDGLKPLVEAAEKEYQQSIAALGELQKEAPGDADIARGIGKQKNVLGEMWDRLDGTRSDGKGRQAATLLDEAVEQLAKTTEHGSCWSAADRAARLWRDLGNKNELPKANASAIKANQAAIRMTASLPNNDSQKDEWLEKWAASFELAGDIDLRLRSYDTAMIEWNKGLTSWEASFLNRVEVKDEWLEHACQCAISLAQAQYGLEQPNYSLAEQNLNKAASFAERIKNTEKKAQLKGDCDARLEQLALFLNMQKALDSAAASINRGMTTESAAAILARGAAASIEYGKTIAADPFEQMKVAREILTQLQSKLTHTSEPLTLHLMKAYEATVLWYEGYLLWKNNKNYAGAEEKFTAGLKIVAELGEEFPALWKKLTKPGLENCTEQSRAEARAAASGTTKP